MKKVFCLLFTALFLLAMSSCIAYADTISTTNYKVFQGYSTEMGYKNWGIDSFYYGSLINGTSLKTISQHDVIAYMKLTQSDIVGYGSYFMTKLCVKDSGSAIANYYALGQLNKTYLLPSNGNTYIRGGIATGVAISKTHTGNVTIDFGFQNSDFQAVGTAGCWANTLSLNY